MDIFSEIGLDIFSSLDQRALHVVSRLSPSRALSYRHSTHGPVQRTFRLSAPENQGSFCRTTGFRKGAFRRADPAAAEDPWLAPLVRRWPLPHDCQNRAWRSIHGRTGHYRRLLGSNQPSGQRLHIRSASASDPHGNLCFEQIWFPGVHANIGGGYLEHEARLSDVALNWMVAGASIIPDGLRHDGSVLRLSPDPTSLLKLGVRPIPVDEMTGFSTSPMHKSVYRRFEAGPVLLYDCMAAYRPDNMRVHVDFQHYFNQSEVQPPQCVADDIELKWQKADYPGRL
jgi:hypothetical protein